MSEIYDPTVGASKDLQQAKRPPSLAGKVVGLYDNTKEQADIILEALGEELRRRHGVKETLNFRGVHYSRPAPLETIEEMARKCDIVVCALGG
jgi:hypothetical protein